MTKVARQLVADGHFARSREATCQTDKLMTIGGGSGTGLSDRPSPSQGSPDEQRPSVGKGGFSPGCRKSWAAGDIAVRDDHARAGGHHEDTNPRCRGFGPHPRSAAWRRSCRSAVAQSPELSVEVLFPTSRWHVFPVVRKPPRTGGIRTDAASKGGRSQMGKRSR